MSAIDSNPNEWFAVFDVAFVGDEAATIMPTSNILFLGQLNTVVQVLYAMLQEFAMFSHFEKGKPGAIVQFRGKHAHTV